MVRLTSDDKDLLPCAEPGCPESVRVRLTTVPSGLVMRRQVGTHASTRRVAVYLRCPAGHVHSYEVPRTG